MVRDGFPGLSLWLGMTSLDLSEGDTNQKVDT